MLLRLDHTKGGMNDGDIFHGTIRGKVVLEDRFSDGIGRQTTHVNDVFGDTKQFWIIGTGSPFDDPFFEARFESTESFGGVFTIMVFYETAALAFVGGVMFDDGDRFDAAKGLSDFAEFRGCEGERELGEKERAIDLGSFNA